MQKLNALLSRHQVPASLITLEILEGLALENPEELNRKILLLQKRASGFPWMISAADILR